MTSVWINVTDADGVLLDRFEVVRPLVDDGDGEGARRLAVDVREHVERKFEVLEAE